MPASSRKHNDKIYESKDPDIGRYSVRKLSFFRRVSMETFNTLAPSPNMFALMEYDVTEARKKIRLQNIQGNRLSFHAFIIKAIAKAVDEFKELNSFLSGKKLYLFDDIDFNVPLELATEGEKFPRQILIRRSNHKSVEEIYREIEDAREKFSRNNSTGNEDEWALRMMRILFLFPRFLRKMIIRNMVNKPLLVKKKSGTIHFTTVAGFADSPGYVIPCIIGNRAVDFTLGSIQKKPATINREISLRDILSLTIIFNHNIIDGAPAARFISRLKQIIENPDFI